MVTSLDQQSDRVQGLEAGADDFLTKPVSDLALGARVRSLARLKQLTDELRVRAISMSAKCCMEKHRAIRAAMATSWWWTTRRRARHRGASRRG
jgi:DNA-binding response OmpR family regulator